MSRVVTIPIGPIYTGGNCRGMIHVVEKGDTLYLLARRYGVSVSDIIYANPFVDIYNLQIGDELCIPTRMIMNPVRPPERPPMRPERPPMRPERPPMRPEMPGMQPERPHIIPGMNARSMQENQTWEESTDWKPDRSWENYQEKDPDTHWNHQWEDDKDWENKEEMES